VSYRIARSLADLRAALAEGAGDRLLVAGGTDLLVCGRDAVRSRPVFDLSRVAELRRVATDGDALILGAAVTFAECLADPRIRALAPLLARVAERFASPQIRAVATMAVGRAAPSFTRAGALPRLRASHRATADDPLT
jgi:CO/xanthine dehydrogenase FAD-binding subunit